MSPLRALVGIAMVLSLVCSGYVFVKMLREISDAEGKKRIPWLAVFGGGLYLLNRYRRSVPDGETWGWFVLLLPTTALLIAVYVVLGFGER